MLNDEHQDERLPIVLIMRCPSPRVNHSAAISSCDSPVLPHAVAGAQNRNAPVAVNPAWFESEDHPASRFGSRPSRIVNG